MTWALDPWSETPRFVPVPDDGRTAWAVPKPEHLTLSICPQPLGPSPEHVATFLQEFAPLHVRPFSLYIADRDEVRAFGILHVAIRVVLLFSLIGGSR